MSSPVLVVLVDACIGRYSFCCYCCGSCSCCGVLAVVAVMVVIVVVVVLLGSCCGLLSLFCCCRRRYHCFQASGKETSSNSLTTPRYPPSATPSRSSHHKPLFYPAEASIISWTARYLTHSSHQSLWPPNRCQTQAAAAGPFTDPTTDQPRPGQRSSGGGCPTRCRSPLLDSRQCKAYW